MISVCIATYNGEKYIGEQIASILKQLNANDEVIIYLMKISYFLSI
jgi:glycosyltransferase involved in cell wall biosynthesis